MYTSKILVKQTPNEYLQIRVDITLSDGSYDTIFKMNDEFFFTPASNNKVLTTTTAFHLLGPKYTISTPFYVSTKGDLCVVGKGDPSIAYPITWSWCLNGNSTINRYSDLQTVAKAIANSGITKINNMYADETYYEGINFPVNW